MPATKPSPGLLYTLKTATTVFTPLEGGGDGIDFSDHVTSLQLVPATSSSVPVVSGRKYVGQTDWSAQVGLVQDLAATGFLRFLIENEGKTYRCVFTFADGSDPVQIDLVMVPASIGGNASDTAIAQSSVTLPADGKPVWLTGGTEG